MQTSTTNSANQCLSSTSLTLPISESTFSFAGASPFLSSPYSQPRSQDLFVVKHVVDRGPGKGQAFYLTFHHRALGTRLAYSFHAKTAQAVLCLVFNGIRLSFIFFNSSSLISPFGMTSICTSRFFVVNQITIFRF